MDENPYRAPEGESFTAYTSRRLDPLLALVAGFICWRVVTPYVVVGVAWLGITLDPGGPLGSRSYELPVSFVTGTALMSWLVLVLCRGHRLWLLILFLMGVLMAVASVTLVAGESPFPLLARAGFVSVATTAVAIFGSAWWRRRPPK